MGIDQNIENGQDKSDLSINSNLSLEEIGKIRKKILVLTMLTQLQNSMRQ